MEKRILTEQEKLMAYYNTALAMNEVKQPSPDVYVVEGNGIKSELETAGFSKDVNVALKKVLYTLTEQIQLRKRTVESGGETTTGDMPAFAPLIAPMVVQAYKTFQAKNTVAIQPITTESGSVYGVVESYGGVGTTDDDGDSLLIGVNGGAILRLDSDMEGNTNTAQDLVEGDVLTLVGGTQNGKKIAIVYGERDSVLVQLKDGMDSTMIPSLVGSTFVKGGKTYTIVVGETNSDVLFKMLFVNYTGHRPVLEIEGSSFGNVKSLKIQTKSIPVHTKFRSVKTEVSFQTQMTISSAHNIDVYSHAMMRGSQLLMNDVSQAIFRRMVTLAEQNGFVLFDYNTTSGQSEDQKVSFLKTKIDGAVALIQKDIRNLAPNAEQFIVCSTVGKTLVSSIHGFTSAKGEDGLFGYLGEISCYYNQDYNIIRPAEEGVVVGLKGDVFTSGLTYVPFIQLGFKQGTIVDKGFTELLYTYAWDEIVEHLNGGKRFYRKIKITNYSL